MPYAYAVKFAQEKKEWITKHRKSKSIFQDNVLIAERYVLFIRQYDGKTFRSQISESSIIVKVPKHFQIHETAVQQKIRSICEEALLQLSQLRIPERIDELSIQFNFEYKAISFKKLRSRWGSCDRNKNIIINTHLVQLPQNIIDYILIHELTHTEHMNHGNMFWQRVEQCLPNYKVIQKQLKQYSPEVLI